VGGLNKKRPKRASMAKSKIHLAWTCLRGAALGAMPGALLCACGLTRPGASIAMFGAFVGGIVALPEVSGRRVTRLFFGTLVAYNLPFFHERVTRWVEEAEDSKAPTPITDRFTDWLFATDVVPRRRWPVVAGLFAGLMFGIAIAIRDYCAVRAGEPGLFLPFARAKDPLWSQASMLALGWSVWAATAVGALTSCIYRRPLLVGLGFTSFFAFAIGFAIGNAPAANPIVGFVFVNTFAAAFALFIAAVWE
jgi:hypothetical protein